MINKTVTIKSKVHKTLLDLAKKYPTRIICGFILGHKENNQNFIENFYLFPAYSGPKIHFKPHWRGYFNAKEHISKFMHANVIGEFHTHPDGNEELTDRDKQILKWLGTKLMVIVTPTKVIAWESTPQKGSRPKRRYNRLPIRIEQ